jgi:hypothetical protein
LYWSSGSPLEKAVAIRSHGHEQNEKIVVQEHVAGRIYRLRAVVVPVRKCLSVETFDESADRFVEVRVVLVERSVSYRVGDPSVVWSENGLAATW